MLNKEEISEKQLESKLKDNDLRGINRENMDLSVSSSEDFYLYANGGWMKTHPLTPEYSRFGTFDQLRENAKSQLKELILNLSSDPESKMKGTNAQKISDLFSLAMDSERLNKEGVAPLLPLMEKINNTPMSEIINLTAWFHKSISSVFFSSGVGPDPADSNINILHIGETGLGLGDRDYYLEKNENNEKILSAYKIYVKRLMELIGYDESGQERVWNNVLEIETEFAIHKKTREERRDPYGRYNIKTLEELKKLYPNIEWERYFTNLGLNDFDKVNVTSPNFISFINEYLPKLSESQIRDYLIYDVVSSSSNLLSDDFQEANFELYDKVMSGKEEMEPRWKRAMSIPNSMFGEAIGELYVKKYFPVKNKEYMIDLVGNLRKALARHISNLSWMSEPTKSKALEKLSTLTIKIGYPEKWKDYSGIEIDPEKSYLENVRKASEWYSMDNYKKLNKEVDKEEWMMTPQTVNAYYMPTTNEICFPAGILQPPYFDPEADDAMNYGAIGVIIGHEMTHGFDDQGRKFDKEGNLVDWWQPEDAEKFNDLSEKLVDQFNKIEVAPGVFANGRYTLGENIADQGGLRVALTAYTEFAENSKSLNKEIDGFSPLERFFISYANVWAGNIREEEILLRTQNDPHSLGRNRVNATLSNLTPFIETFKIKEGDKMFRPENERIVIW